MDMENNNFYYKVKKLGMYKKIKAHESSSRIRHYHHCRGLNNEYTIGTAITEDSENDADRRQDATATDFPTTDSDTITAAPSMAPVSDMSTRGFGANLMIVVLAVVLSYLAWKLYRWYRDKQENARQAYRMAQADRVLGDMQMVSTIEDNELI